MDGDRLLRASAVQEVVVGLVRNTKYYELCDDFRPIAFVAEDQDEDPSPGGTFVLRTNAPLGEFYRAAEEDSSAVQCRPLRLLVDPERRGHAVVSGAGAGVGISPVGQQTFQGRCPPARLLHPAGAEANAGRSR